MLGEEVTVESNRDGGERYRLHLRGVGRRGEIRSGIAPAGSGTAVRISLKTPVVESLRPLADLVKVYAPMVPHKLEVDVDDQSSSIRTGWLQELTADEFHKWTLDAVTLLQRNRAGRSWGDFSYRWFIAHSTYYRRRRVDDDAINWPKGWPEYRHTNVRLLASFENHSLLCLRGLAIQPIGTPGFVGVINLESAAPDVSRTQILNRDVTDILRRANEAIRSKIVENLNALAEGLLIPKLGFLGMCVSLYGREPILESSLPWISLLKLPGEVRLISSAAFLEQLTKAPSLFVAYGTGPWTAMKHWGELDSKFVTNAPAIVVDSLPQDSLQYHVGPEEKVGTLGDLWEACHDAPLFGTILRLVAEAWQVSLENLTAQEGWHQSGSSLWAV